MLRLAAALLLALLTSPADARGPAKPKPPVVGQASVVDGDTLDIHGQRIRLFAVDAPESSQLCRAPSGRPYRCGAAAANALSDFIARRPVTCTPTGKKSYERIVARCNVGGRSINEWLVSNGWALAYREFGKDYVAAEAQAQAARRGIHGGTFDAPWDFRKAKRKKS